MLLALQEKSRSIKLLARDILRIGRRWYHDGGPQGLGIFVEIPFRLKRRETPLPAAALFVPSADARSLLAVVAAVGGRWPDLFAVADGFVVVPLGAVPPAIPGTIQLRRLAGELYLPADADLLPALRIDETADLTASRGLVFLPGGTVLAFDSSAPVSESAAISLGTVRREEWTLFPERPEQPEKLHAIRFDAPEDAIAAILEGGRPDGTNPLGEAIPDDARPAAGSTGQTIAANSKLAMGQFLNWMGRTFGVKSWAEAGANMARRAMEQVPRLSEKVFGEQEAALREVLRQFQAGDIEKALRRAPIAVPDPDGKPAQIGGGATLSETDARYSLRSLLGSGGGPAVAWLGGGDVWAQLATEYRKLAEEAVRKGDFRRAAYVYGVLLRDPRQAAKVLDSGGMHRDAAILYRDKLNDRAAAAACFERGGCWDEAVGIYQELQEFEKAGDLYQRLGDESAACEMYASAAEKMAGSGQYRAAGDLTRGKAGNVARAEFYFRQGWDNGGPDALGCSGRLVEDRIHAGEWDDLRAIVDQAEIRFAPPRSDEAGRFFAHLTEAADHSAPKPVAEDLRDRAKLALAVHLRDTARAGRSATAAISSLFGNHASWAAPLVRDAREALRREATVKPRGADGTAYPTVRFVRGPVSAAVVGGSFDLIIAGAGGELVIFRAESGEAEPIPLGMNGSPAALSCSPDGQAIVVLTTQGASAYLVGKARNSDAKWTFWMPADLPRGMGTVPYLEPVMTEEADQLLVRVHFEGSSALYLAPTMQGISGVLVRGKQELTPVFAVQSGDVGWHWSDRKLSDGVHATPIPWHPAVPPGSSFVFAPVDWLTPAVYSLELCGIAADGAVYWTEAKRLDSMLAASTATTTTPAGYQAACLIRPGLLAAVTADNHVHWLRADGSPTLRRWGPPRVIADPGRAVFVANRPNTNEIVVVFDDGSAVRVPKP